MSDCDCRKKYTTFGNLQDGDKFVFFKGDPDMVFEKVIINRINKDYTHGYIIGTIVTTFKENETGVLRVGVS